MGALDKEFWFIRKQQKDFGGPLTPHFNYS